MKIQLVILCLVSVVAAIASTPRSNIILPKNYEAILDCPPQDDAPGFMLVRRNHTFYLAATMLKKVKLIELGVYDRDFGHMTYSPLNQNELGKLSKFAAFIHVDNNESDLITDGAIQAQDPDSDQQCQVLGKPRLK